MCNVLQLLAIKLRPAGCLVRSHLETWNLRMSYNSDPGAATSFVAPGDPQAAHGSPACEYESNLLI